MTNATLPTAVTSQTSPLTGARGWLITDGKAGMDVQVQGVSDALGLDAEIKTVAPRALYRALGPLGTHRSNKIISQNLAAHSRHPGPMSAIATGRASIPYIRRLYRSARHQTFCVVLQDPKTGAGIADLIWVPAHDRRRGPNVITTITSPHSFSPDQPRQSA